MESGVRGKKDGRRAEMEGKDVDEVEGEVVWWSERRVLGCCGVSDTDEWLATAPRPFPESFSVDRTGKESSFTGRWAVCGVEC
jgi:hypothetical protein